MEFELFAVRVKTTCWPPGEEYPDGEWFEPGRFGGDFSDAREPPTRNALFADRATAERLVKSFGDVAEVVTFKCVEIDNASQRTDTKGR